MPRYEVEAWVGTVTVTVEADNEDEALTRGTQEMNLADHLESATWSVRRVDA